MARLGLAHLLEPIRKTLEGTVGNTTLCELYASQPDKLIVHGELSSARAMEAKAVPGSAKRSRGRQREQVTCAEHGRRNNCRSEPSEFVTWSAGTAVSSACETARIVFALARTA